MLRETIGCHHHESCPAHLVCVAGHCGDGQYLRALASQPCSEHQLCEDLLLGTDCCLDIAGGLEKLARGDESSAWGKKCCDNPRSPITRPSANISVELIKKVSDNLSPPLLSSHILIPLAGPEDPGALQSLGPGGGGV